MIPDPRPVVYEARDVTRTYPGTVALGGVSVELRAGEVHALIGENGAGKSTLVKLLAGIERPTAGSLWLDGEQVVFPSVREAAAAGIGLIHQELQLFPDLPVEENLFVGRERLTRWGLVDRGMQRRMARDVLARLGQPIDPTVLVGALPLGLQQIVEIARALVADTRILMMDEPTSALTSVEIDVLFGVIRDLAARGVAIVYISHHLQELLEIADRVTVLRDGRVVGSASRSDVDVPWIVTRMTGNAVEGGDRRLARSAGTPVLRATRLTLPARPGRTGLDVVALDISAGEVLGVYGVLGAGRTELFETLLGLHPDASGEVTVRGRPVMHLSVSDRVAAGLAMVPEDRQAAGLVQTMTVAENVTLSSLDRLAPAGLLRSGIDARASAPFAERLHLKAPSLDAPVVSLSGGNQQKVVIARGLLSGPAVILLDDPTRGVDVGAKAEILSTMRALAAEGMAVAFASSDLAEILSAADRIVVMARGRVRADFSREDATEEALAAAASVALAVNEQLSRGAH